VTFEVVVREGSDKLINGRSFSRDFVENGAFPNVMPFCTIKKLGKAKQDLIGTNMQMTTFTKDLSTVVGVLIVKIKVGPKKSTVAILW